LPFSSSFNSRTLIENLPHPGYAPWQAVENAFIRHAIMTGAFNTPHKNWLLSLKLLSLPGRDKREGAGEILFQYQRAV
jgi:hypothetical protein